MATVTITPSVIKLQVKEVPKSTTNWEAVAAKGQDWFQLAKQKQQEARSRGMDEALFRDSKIALSMIYTEVKSHAKEMVTELGVWICVRQEGKQLEGIALISKKTGYLYGIASHPKNLPHPLNRMVERVSGVGKALIEKLVDNCVQIERPLSLVSMDSSLGFYEKMGMERATDDADGPSPQMVLSLEKCRAMIKRRGDFSGGTPLSNV